MRHLLLAREREPLGQRVEHARQLQPRRTVLRSGLIPSVVVMRTPLLQRPRRGAAVLYGVAGRR